MSPRPAARMPGSTSRVTRKRLRTLVRIVVSQSSTLSSLNVFAMSTPALFTRVSIGPSALLDVGGEGLTCASLPTSAGRPSALMPAPRNSSSSRSSRSGVRAQTPTDQPARPREKATARPIPSVAPVTRATRVRVMSGVYRLWRARPYLSPPMAEPRYVFKCSRRHRVAVDPARYWAPARCPACKSPVDRLRTARLRPVGPGCRAAFPAQDRAAWY